MGYPKVTNGELIMSALTKVELANLNRDFYKAMDSLGPILKTSVNLSELIQLNVDGVLIIEKIIHQVVGDAVHLLVPLRNGCVLLKYSFITGMLIWTDMVLPELRGLGSNASWADKLSEILLSQYDDEYAVSGIPIFKLEKLFRLVVDYDLKMLSKEASKPKSYVRYTDFDLVKSHFN